VRERDSGDPFGIMSTDAPEPGWSSLAPVIDELVDHLPAADRDVLLLRYYHNQSHAHIASCLGLTETVARKRAFRALDKLRVLLRKRGIATTAAALASVLPAHAAPAAPPLLVGSIIHAAQAIKPVAPSLITSFFTAMDTSQKVAMGAALMLLAAATVYTLAPEPEAAAPAILPVASLTSAQGAGAVLRTRKQRLIPSTAEDRLERLKAIIAIVDPVEQQSELIAYLDHLPADLFPETVSCLSDIAPKWDKQPLSMTMSAWAKLDPLAALAFTQSREKPNGNGYSLVQEVLGAWAAIDPQAAVDWAKSNPDPVWGQMIIQAVLIGETWIENGDGAPSGLAWSDPEKALKVIADIKDAKDRESTLETVGQRLAGYPEAMERLMEAATPEQEAMLQHAEIQAIERSDPARAAALLLEHPAAASPEEAAAIYGRWNITDSRSAEAAIEKLPAGEEKKAIISGILQSKVRSSPDRALAMLDSHPEVQTDDLLTEMAGHAGLKSPQVALQIAGRVIDDSARQYLVASQLSQWLKNDAMSANQWLENHPQPDAVMQLLSSK